MRSSWPSCCCMDYGDCSRRTSLSHPDHSPDGRTMNRALIVSLGLLTLAGVARAQVAEDPEAKLHALGLTLPPVAAPIANYVRAVRTGNLVFLAGTGECSNALKGKVGAEVSIDSAYASAKRVGLCLL